MYMKKMEKLVPAAVAGLVLAAGTLDARAEEAALPVLPVDENTPVQEEKQQSDMLDTTIKDVEPAPQPDAGEESGNPGGEEDGGQEEQKPEGSTTDQVVVNPDVNDNGEVTNDGTLDITTTPDPDSTTEETIPGEPSTETVANPDGSTTTTTTTPTTTETTEKSETEIEGEITGEPDTSEPTEEEKEEIQGTLSGALESIKNEDGSYRWDELDKVGSFDSAHEAGGEDADGNPTHTITLTQSEAAGKPLTADELGAVLGGVTLAPVEGEENAYTYTDANGAVVTVRPQDSSTETTTTTWVITLTEKKNTVEGTGEVEIPDVEPPLADLPPVGGGESGSLSVKEVLDKVDGDTFDGEAATITKDADGNTTKIVSGSKTYEFTYTPGEAITVKDLSIADIFALLPQGGDSPYTMGEDGIYFNGHKVAFDEATGVYTPVTVTMTMTDTQAGKEDHVTQGGQEATPPDDAVTETNTEKEAAIQAVVNALHADKVTGITADSVKAQLDKDTDGNGVWTVTVTAAVDGKVKTFTYTVTSSSATEEEKWNATKVEEKDIENLVDGSGSTTTTTGNAYVSGETIVWTESVADQDHRGLTVRWRKRGKRHAERRRHHYCCHQDHQRPGRDCHQGLHLPL